MMSPYSLKVARQLVAVIYKIKPYEISRSSVRVSFDLSEYAGDITGLGISRLV